MKLTPRIILLGMQILIDHNWLKDHAVVIDKNIIQAIVPQEMVSSYSPAICYQFAPSDYLMPGLIDLHIHGCGGDDVMDGTELTLQKISDLLAQKGVTGFLATTMTSHPSHLEKALISIAKAKLFNSGLLGIHLEGPFIAKEKVGAQSIHHLQLPNIELLQYWQALSLNNIRMITLAPELPHAISFIQKICEMNIIAAIGHSNATYEQTLQAIEAGATYATHLFNAMSGLHHRFPGVAGAFLLNQETTTELIVDGEHLHPAIVNLAFKIKGKEKLILVSDAMRASCLGDGCYELGGQTVEVKGGRASLQNGVLAGSTLHLLSAIKNMVEATYCSLIDAIQLASYNPARILKLSNQKGKIKIGFDADIIVTDSHLINKMTMRAGQVIFKKIDGDLLNL